MTDIRTPPIPLQLTEVEQITLNDALRTAGLKKRQIEDVLLLLSFKPPKVQRAFYLRSIGWTYYAIGVELQITEKGAWKTVQEQCSDIHGYFCTN